MEIPTFIDLHEDVLSPEVCSEIIRRFEEDTENHFEGIVVGEDGATRVDNSIKECKELTISHHQNWMDIDKILYESMGVILNRLCDRYPGFGVATAEDEGYRIKRYLPNGVDRFDPHVDVGGGHNSHRQLVVCWYLNDVEEGGETHFPVYNISVKPKAGTAATFPPFWTHYHEGKTPISGPKYIIVGWMTYPISTRQRTPVEITHE
jgi:hypothetical protein